jgi:hypothetical protein
MSPTTLTTELGILFTRASDLQFLDEPVAEHIDVLHNYGILSGRKPVATCKKFCVRSGNSATGTSNAFLVKAGSIITRPTMARQSSM